MAHVLVAHADDGVRHALVEALREEARHSVVAASDGVWAVTALWRSDGPMVALMDERLLPFGGMDVFGVVANDQATGPMGRHRYVLLSTWPDHIQARGRTLLARLGAPVLSLPFELDTLLRVVDEAAAVILAGHPQDSALRTPRRVTPVTPVTPEGMAGMAGRIHPAMYLHPAMHRLGDWG